MFNPLTPAEVVGAIGATVRGAVRGGELSSDFERDQLMSAYSATRHLSVEISHYPEELRRFADSLAARIESGSGDPRLDAELAAFAAQLRERSDADGIGAAVAGLLERLREGGGAAGHGLLAEVRARLRELADREVELLAEGLS